MIGSFFLPEFFKNHRLLAQRIVSFAIHGNTVSCAQVYAHGRNTTIQMLAHASVKQDASTDKNTDAVSQALTQLAKNIKKNDLIVVTIPSSIVIFKELQFPFLDKEKIRLVLNFEIESMLPFSLDEAMIDFIVTKQQPDQKTSTVLVAVVRNSDLHAALTPYLQAGIQPDRVTIDLFALYNLYTQIPAYQSTTSSIALVDIGEHSTRIAFIQQGTLRLTRYLQRGLETIVHLIAQETSLQDQEVRDKLEQLGIDTMATDPFSRCAHKHMMSLCNDVQFTLNSFSLKLNSYDGIGKILFSGLASNVKNLPTFGSDALQIPCELFDLEHFFALRSIKNKSRLPKEEISLATIALGAALTCPALRDFNILNQQPSARTKNALFAQGITAIILVLGVIGTIAGRGYLQISTLSEAITKFETRQRTILKNANLFAQNKFPKSTFLHVVLKEAEKAVEQKKEIWAPFSQRRIHPLIILNYLTDILDRKQFDITINRVTISGKEGGTIIDVEGYFKSKTGSAHFTHFAELETKFKDSSYFKLAEQINPAPAEDKGVSFLVKLKEKEA